MKQMTMKDIADICGVSLKTVSRVLNNKNNVKVETREKVLSVIEQNGYQVNMLAKGLRQKKTNTLIFFIDKHKENYWSIWHAQMLQHLFDQAKNMGYKIVVSPSCATGYLKDNTDGFLLLSSKMVDGAIILDNVNNDGRIEFLNRHKIPYVLMGQMDDQDVNWVDLDNFKTGYMGGEFLIKKGYKKICFMLGQEQFHVNQLRARGLKEIAEVHKIDYSIVYEVDSMEMAYRKTNEIFIENRKGYDALFISGDERAIGAYRALSELKISIPKDVAVMGIDNISLCDYLYPSLTSMDQNCTTFARKVMELLEGLINHSNGKTENHILIENRNVIEREST